MKKRIPDKVIAELLSKELDKRDERFIRSIRTTQKNFPSLTNKKWNIFWEIHSKYEKKGKQ